MKEAAVDAMEVPRRFWDEETLGDPSRFMTLVSTMRLTRRVTGAVDGVIETHGLSRNGYLLLMHLELSESGTRILSSLARDLIVHPTTITLTIDRLEAEGLVKKLPHQTDRRATQASLTRSGRNLARRITDDLAEIGFGLGALSDAQVARLDSAVNMARLAIGDGGR